MKRNLLAYVVVIAFAANANAQVEPGAGKWKTWFISSGKDYRLPAPLSNKDEVAAVLSAQKNVDAAMMQKIQFWNAGAPGYRWYTMVAKLWMTDISGKGALAYVLNSTAIYDATVAAWDTKYAHSRLRPYAVDSRIKALIPKIESPSYPCEHSVAAGVAVTLISHFYPTLADSAKRMAEQMMASRVAAGVAFPSDTKDGFDLGKRIAEKEIEATKDYISTKQFDPSKIPTTPGLWTGKMAMLPTAGLNKTIALDSASQFRPGPPPDWAKEMEELKNFKQTFRTKANAWYFASQPTTDDLLNKKIFEYNLHTNAPRAARIYAAVAVSFYDAFTACFEAKYTYWGIRPDQYDPTYKSLVPTPPFPGYPSGHATMSGVVAELLPYFFPGDKKVFQQYAKDGAESRFHAGIHFRTDNDAGLVLGQKIGAKVVEKLRADGAEEVVKFVASNK
jgi:membrane-associated phospholipid phosphatase